MSLHLTEILYDALRARIGIVVETDNAESLRQKLYTLRRGNPEFEPLAFVISPMNGSDLWILNKGNQDGQRVPETYS